MRPHQIGSAERLACKEEVQRGEGPRLAPSHETIRGALQKRRDLFGAGRGHADGLHGKDEAAGEEAAQAGGAEACGAQRTAVRRHAAGGGCYACVLYMSVYTDICGTHACMCACVLALCLEEFSTPGSGRVEAVMGDADIRAGGSAGEVLGLENAGGRKQVAVQAECRVRGVGGAALEHRPCRPPPPPAPATACAPTAMPCTWHYCDPSRYTPHCASHVLRSARLAPATDSLLGSRGSHHGMSAVVARSQCSSTSNPAASRAARTCQCRAAHTAQSVRRSRAQDRDQQDARTCVVAAARQDGGGAVATPHRAPQPWQPLRWALVRRAPATLSRYGGKRGTCVCLLS